MLSRGSRDGRTTSQTWETIPVSNNNPLSEKAILGATLGIPGHSQSNSWKRTHDLTHAKTPFSEQFLERRPELAGSQNCSPNSRSVFGELGLRGPVAILFISRDTCSGSIAKLSRACFCGASHNLSRDMLQTRLLHRCACVKLSTWSTPEKGPGLSCKTSAFCA